MRPAFSTTSRAAAFALLLLVLLLSPVLAGKRLLPSRAETYASATMNQGGYPYITQQIFQEKGDLDVAFAGSSHIWAAINTPYFQEELSKKLGHKATAATLGWNWCGFDAVYFIAKDLFAHRKVHMLVIYDEFTPRSQFPHSAASHWFRYGDNWADLAGLTLPARAAFYAEALRGMPQNILSLVHPHIEEWLRPVDDGWLKMDYDSGSSLHLGSLSVPYGFGFNYEKNVKPPAFVAFTPPHEIPASDVLVYSSQTKDRFRFTGPMLPPPSLFFAKKLAVLAEENHVKIVVLHIPTVSEPRTPFVPERECWPEVLGGPVSLLGIAPGSFLADISDQDKLKLFYNDEHLNKNGQDYFTRAITPALLSLYEQ